MLFCFSAKSFLNHEFVNETPDLQKQCGVYLSVSFLLENLRISSALLMFAEPSQSQKLIALGAYE